MPAGERLALVDAATAALKDLSEVIHQVPNGQLGEVVGSFGQLCALVEAGMVIATAEAEQRGEVEASQAKSTTAWVADCDWFAQPGVASAIAKAAGILARPDMAPLADSIRSTDIAPQVAVTVAAEFDKIGPALTDEAHPVILDLMIKAGEEHGASTVRQMHDLLIERYGKPGVFQDQQDRLHRSVELSTGRRGTSGLYHYDLTVDPEGRANLEAAIGPLSAPTPQPDGQPDTRPVGRRRGEALIEVCRRSAAAADGVPAQPKATLHVTMSFDDLAAALGGGEVFGSLATGTLLAPHTVRKLACDAKIIPQVLGGGGEVLDQGRAQRLFTPWQIRALWARDKKCTFDGCDAPVHWTDAHHLRHWADGGLTDIDNGASLCGPHHTIVHRDQLAGTVVDGHVIWDRRPGSYQQQLARGTGRQPMVLTPAGYPS